MAHIWARIPVAVSNYQTVNLKRELVERVDRYVERNQEGFTNRSEFIHAAVREFLDGRDRERIQDLIEASVEAKIKEWQEKHE